VLIQNQSAVARRRLARRLPRLSSALVVSFLAVGYSQTAAAAVTHTYVPSVSENITRGVPSGPAPGPIGDQTHLLGDSRHLWATEGLPTAPGSRTAKFDAASGEYAGVAIVPEGEVSDPTEGVAVAGTGEAEKIYIGAVKGSQSVVAVFDAQGKLLGTWSGAHTVNKSFGEIGGENVGLVDGVAVDRSGNPTTTNDIYVLTRAKETSPAVNVVDVFTPGVGGEEGEAVGEITGTCATPGVCSGNEVIPFERPDSVAIGAGGDVFVVDGTLGKCGERLAKCAVDVFEPVSGFPGVYSFLFSITGTPAGEFLDPLAVATDVSSGNIYVAEGATREVDEFDPAGKLIGRIKEAAPHEPFHNLRAVGVDPLSGNVFVGDFDEARLERKTDAFGPDVKIPDVEVTEPPESLTPHSAVLRGAVDPVGAGAGEVSCEFDYGLTASLGKHVVCAQAVPDGDGNVPVVSEVVQGLVPDTTYHYRLAARNTNGANTGECPLDCGEFTTPGPGVFEQSVTEVAATSATLGGSVDPHGSPTSYFFQYSLADTANCEPQPGVCTDIPAAPGSPLGAGDQPVRVSQELQGLEPSTVYHYRLVAESKLSSGEPELFAGPDQTFTTQASGTSLELLDNRHWELVSPSNKHGGVIAGIEGAGLTQAAANGEGITYVTNRPIGTGAAGLDEQEQIISRRLVDSQWTSQNVSAPHAAAAGVAAGTPPVEYPMFSSDLGAAVLEPDGEYTSLGSCASPPDSERTPYLRHNLAECAGALGSFQPIATAAAGFEDVPAGTKFGGLPRHVTSDVRVVGAASDLSHVAVSSSVVLVKPPIPGETSVVGLYLWSATARPTEALQTISVLPDGKLVPGIAQLGSESIVTRNAISDDGSRVIWSEREGHLYLRDMALRKTVQVDTPEAGCEASEECGQGAVTPIFQGASSDGSSVFFTDAQRLTASAGKSSGNDLYVCEIRVIAGSPTCELTDLTGVSPGSHEGADVQGGILGASADGSAVYFVANGVLAAGAEPGTCHVQVVGGTCSLYLARRGSGGWEPAEVVATLGGEDWPDWKAEAGSGLSSLTARVSSSGRFVVFMSDRSLTGYDNRDAATGSPDEEVFLYDRDAGKVVCVSCDASGVRPKGLPFAELKEGLRGLGSNGLFSPEQGIAASVPAWSPSGLKIAFHQSRYLSDSGRVFFDSSEALVSQDINNNGDVYEYEPTKEGTCSSTSYAFVASAKGCVELISSGTAAGESAFMDAGESGNDVFFLTPERLVPGKDTDSARDIYDAHVCQSAADCSPEVELPSVCTTADSCRMPAGEQAGVFGAPASATSSGTGNLTPETGASKPGTTAKAKRLRAALKACHRLRLRRRRIACERAAHKRYEAHSIKRHLAFKRGPAR
jgi:hypothetical protein